MYLETFKNGLHKQEKFKFFWDSKTSKRSRGVIGKTLQSKNYVIKKTCIIYIGDLHEMWG